MDSSLNVSLAVAPPDNESISECSSSTSQLGKSMTEMTALTWNCEGLKRNSFSLKYFVDAHSPDFVFLNETQVFKFDAKEVTDLFMGEYCHALNTDDMHDPELGLYRNKSHGGTMILWKRSFNKFITVLPTETASFLPILFHPPSSKCSLHISLYLPTSGKESEFLEEITQLKIFLENILETQPLLLVFIRGDSNVNVNNKERAKIFENFLTNFKIFSVRIHHKTYHHFLGEGLFDSNIDVILHSKKEYPVEEIENICCKFEFPFMESHHDLIVSKF